MNTKRFALATIAAFIFIFVFEFLYHGHLLKSAYEATSDLWRPEAEMKDFMHICFIVKFLVAATMTYIFTRHYEGKGIMEGVRFGAMIGFLMGISQFSMYAYMPIPMTLGLAWFVGSFIEMTGVGMIIALTYRK
jgi:hypothetical protein